MRENRPSGSEGGVAFGPSLPLSGPFVNPPCQRPHLPALTLRWPGRAIRFAFRGPKPDNPHLPVMKKSVLMRSALLAFTLIAAASLPVVGGETLPLSKLDLTLMSAGWGRPKPDQSVTGTPLRIAKQEFPAGVGTHAESVLFVDLHGQAERFQALVGVDDNAQVPKASLEFAVYGDDQPLFQSGLCKLGQPAKRCDVSLQGVKILMLEVTASEDGIAYDHADWADARIIYTGQPPRAIRDPVPPEPPVILTPPAPPSPRINGPKVHGLRPGSPFLFRIPATGERPMAFSAEGLPAGLVLDPATGVITGTTSARGEHKTLLRARNARGEATREFRIVVGDSLALTPYMGWNTWYLHFSHISDALLRKAADDMISSGLADQGYQYVSLDDCWMVKPGDKDPQLGGPPRLPDGSLRPNRNFPDMKALTDYIHAKGLKTGIYISPGPRTCAGYEGSYQHEAQDARTFAAWGFDLLKYDWCSYAQVAGGKQHQHFIKPYQLMWDELRKLDRDLVFNLCQYGQDKVWEWGGQVGHSWRTTDDLGWVGGHLSKGIYLVGLANARHWPYARPGAWNDPDYLSIGRIDANGGEGKPTPLTPSEQYSHVTMWCLMASPLVFAGDMGRMDPFTLGLLCNPEVNDLDLDPLGRQAAIIRLTESELILLKPLEDGSRAVGLFNLRPRPATVAVSWKNLCLPEPLRLRDPWRQQDLPVPAGDCSAKLPGHGVALFRVWPK